MEEIQMSDLVVITFLSLDGVMQSPGAPDEDRSGGFELGGWQVPLLDDSANKIIDGLFAVAGGFLLGRKTYDIFSAYWPKQTDPKNTAAAALNQLPKYVVSHSLTDANATWNNSHVIHGDSNAAVAAEITRIKRESLPKSKQLHVWGSGNLVRTLAQHDLVDEYQLWFHPVILGSGKRLFEPGFTPAAFEVVGTEQTKKGITINRYRRAGNVKTGTFDES
jgi:dihydrofolate reductase